jgi:hypothetical protein
VFVVRDGVVDMHHRYARPERLVQLTPGRICYSGTGDDHVARTTPQVRILVVEHHGRT